MAFQIPATRLLGPSFRKDRKLPLICKLARPFRQTVYFLRGGENGDVIVLINCECLHVAPFRATLARGPFVMTFITLVPVQVKQNRWHLFWKDKWVEGWSRWIPFP